MINKMLHTELDALYQHLEQLIDYLKQKADPQSGSAFSNSDLRKTVEEHIAKLLPIEKLLELHLNLGDTAITSVDFYGLFQAQFNAGRYKKGAVYYIKEGYDGEPELVTDEARLTQELTIHNCMRSMSLVPINIASNAMKYMLPEQQAEVVLLKTARRNILTISNLGPKSENFEQVMEEGVRGGNSSVAGMGLGLAHIKAVVGHHKSLLDASFDVSQDKQTVIKVGDTEYVKFSVVLTYWHSVSEQAADLSTSDFFKRIPLIIMHNMVDILANLFSITDKLRRLPLRSESEKLRADFPAKTDTFYLQIEQMQEIIKLCLYIRNDYSTKKLLGNVCPVDIGQFSDKIIGMLQKYRYDDLEIETVYAGRYTQTVNTYSAIYPVLYGLYDYLLGQTENGEQLNVDIDSTSLMISCPGIDFQQTLPESRPAAPGEESLEQIRCRMYLAILKDCQINLIVNRENIILSYNNVQIES